MPVTVRETRKHYNNAYLNALEASLNREIGRQR
jgi:hypothetical protein